MELAGAASRLVIDTSALLAVFFAESRASWVTQQLDAAAERYMSTVNLAETLVHLRDRAPARAAEVEVQLITEGGIVFVPPDTSAAGIAAAARLRWPLNFGDCFVYALAKEKQATILTLDKDFRCVDQPTLMP